MDRESAIFLHTALLYEFSVGCQPNKDINPDSMLYYVVRDGQLSTYLFSLKSHDPIDLVSMLEAELTERFPDVRKVKKKTKWFQ